VSISSIADAVALEVFKNVAAPDQAGFQAKGPIPGPVDRQLLKAAAVNLKRPLTEPEKRTVRDAFRALIPPPSVAVSNTK
jgi:hypothetical protein